MIVQLIVTLDVERNLVRVDGARIRGIGDLESELKVKGAEAGEGGGEITLEAAGLPVPLTQEAPKPGNAFRETPKPKASPAAAQGSLAGDLMLMGFDEDTAAHLLSNHSIDRLRKLLQWVRTVQAREGVHSPTTLFMKCLAKGVQ